MGLKNLVIGTATVMVPNGVDFEPLVVRGLGLDAVVSLLREQGPAMQAVYAKAILYAQRAADPSVATELSGDLVVALLSDSPVLAAKMIALGCGEPDEWETVMVLPLSVQIELLEQIGILTFAAEGGAKKAVETVIRVMLGTQALFGRKT